MTRAELLASGNSLFADSSNITASELRTYLNGLYDTFYPATVTDSQSTETYTTKAVGNTFNYSLNLTKNGGLLHVELIFTGLIGGVMAGQNIFTWKNTNPIFELATLAQKRVFANSPSGNSVTLFLSKNVVSTQGNITGGQTFYADFILRLKN